MIRELGRVVLTVAVPEEGLQPGDVGTVVRVYRDEEAYGVEFLTLEGHTAGIWHARKRRDAGHHTSRQLQVRPEESSV